MKILITGSDGQLGKALRKVLPENDTYFTTRKELDITDKNQSVQQIISNRPDIVIHTAAYTDVDGCEKNKPLAYSVNVIGTKNVSLACQKINALLVYISTDFIFDGAKKIAYQENDRPNPLSYYGKTKLEGELLVKKLEKHLIIRTSWVFGEGPAFAKASTGKKNFVQTILNLSKTKKEISVVNDQVGCPTYAADLASAIWQLINPKSKIINQVSGIYHITNQGSCSWYEFAKEIVKIKKLKIKIVPISTAEWRKIKPDSATRPSYSVLDSLKLKRAGIVLRPWQEALREYLTNL